MADGVDLRIEGRVAHMVLARPERRNAFDTAMLAAFEDALTALGRSRSVEVAILRAEGSSFCAGTDLKELETLDAGDTLHWQRRTAALVEGWSRLEATTVTAFNGPAIGSGAVVGLASDLRIAADTTFFSFPEAAWAIPLTWSGIPVLTALLGPDRTKRLLLLAERLDAADLARLDLVMEVVPPSELEAATGRLVERLLEIPHAGRLMAKRAVAATAAAPGFLTNAFEPFLASLGIAARGQAAFGYKDGKG